MAKARKMPLPWKTSHRKGFYYQPFGRGHMMFSPDKAEWWLSMPRGTTSVADYWGPWNGKFEDLEAIGVSMAGWEKSLSRAGWFKMKFSEQANESRGCTADDLLMMSRHVARLPRCALIPRYLLVPSDNDMAPSQASASILKVGGVDIVVDDSRDAWAPSVNAQVELSVRAPGQGRYSEGTKRLTLNASALDATIDFLLRVRSTIVSEDAFQAAHGIVDGRVNATDMREKFGQRVAASDEISRLFTELQGASAEEVATVRMMFQMIRSKEMEVDMVYPGEVDQGNASLH